MQKLAAFIYYFTTVYIAAMNAKGMMYLYVYALNLQLLKNKFN